MKILFSLLTVLILCSCANDKKEKETPVVSEQKEVIVTIDTTLVTDSSWGPIKKNTVFADLQTAYGAAQVKDERICGAECVDSVDVTLVYPGSKKEFIIYWEDSSYHKKIAMIRCYGADATYHTSNGIQLGTSLKELVRLNGKPIAFSGFGWDYGGGIISLNNGNLERSNVHFNLDISEQTGPVDDKVYGDTELNTDMPRVKKLLDKIHVIEIFLSFSND